MWSFPFWAHSPWERWEVNRLWQCRVLGKLTGENTFSLGFGAVTSFLSSHFLPFLFFVPWLNKNAAALGDASQAVRQSCTFVKWFIWLLLRILHSPDHSQAVLEVAAGSTLLDFPPPPTPYPHPLSGMRRDQWRRASVPPSGKQGDKTKVFLLFFSLSFYFDELQCIYFSFVSCAFGVISKKYLAKSNVMKIFLSVFFQEVFKFFWLRK